MGPSTKAVTWAAAILGGLCMLIVGLINLADPSYGGEFLRMMSSIYPGADSARTIGKVLLGTVYGLLDGAISGFIFMMLYRMVARDEHTVAHQAHQ